MFELADKLVGIYKTFDVTKTITINPKLLQAEVDAHGEQGNEIEE